MDSIGDMMKEAEKHIKTLKGMYGFIYQHQIVTDQYKYDCLECLNYFDNVVRDIETLVKEKEGFHNGTIKELKRIVKYE